MTRLENGQILPSLTLPAVGGGSLSLPSDLAGGFGAVLVYRGAWCPYCRGQLAAFGRAKSDLDGAGVTVAALSVEDEPTSAGLVEKLHLPFVVGHSANLEQVAAALGCYVDDERRYLQSTGFVLTPDGAVATAVYSSGAIGRLVPEDVIGLVGYLKSQH